jgi:WD40 repeat protein
LELSLTGFAGKGKMICHVTASPDGKAIAAAVGVGLESGRVAGNVVGLWETSTGKLTKTFTFDAAKPEGAAVTCLGFSHRGRSLAVGWTGECGAIDTAEENGIIVFDVATGRTARTLNHGRKQIHAVGFTTDEKVVCVHGFFRRQDQATVAYWDFSTSTVTPWRTKTNILRNTNFRHGYRGPAAIGHLGRILVYRSDADDGRSPIIAHHITPGTLYKRPYEPANGAQCFAISHDGSLLAIGYQYGVAFGILRTSEDP